MVLLTTIHDKGFCNHCGNKRFRVVNTISEEEMGKLKELKIDPDFLALFEGVSDEG